MTHEEMLLAKEIAEGVLKYGCCQVYLFAKDQKCPLDNGTDRCQIAGDDDNERRVRARIILSRMYINGQANEMPPDDDKPLKDAVKHLIKMLQHYGPQPPDHHCGDTDAQCDCLCVEWAEFSKIIQKYRSRLGQTK